MFFQVPCGYAAVKDVRTGVHEDRMDSFVLSETFKYLYLLFTKPSELPINLSDFVFTTEAHLLPLSLARITKNVTMPSANPLVDIFDSDSKEQDTEFSRSCPNAHSVFPGKQQFAENIRKPMKNYVNNVCPNRYRSIKRKLRGSEFQSGNKVHLNLLSDMGIKVGESVNGKLELVLTASNAKTPTDAEEGLLFMQEVIEIGKLTSEHPENPPKAVIFATEEIVSKSSKPIPPSKCADNADGQSKNKDGPKSITVKTLPAGPAQFGLQLKDGIIVDGKLAIAKPYKACGTLENAAEVKGKIVLLERGDCLFVDKARVIQEMGAIGGIVVDNGSSAGPESTDPNEPLPLFAMSGDETSDDITIPMVFLFSAKELIEAHKRAEADGGLEVLLSDHPKDKTESTLKSAYLNIDDNVKSTEETVQSILTAKSQQSKGGEETCGGDELITLVKDKDGDKEDTNKQRDSNKNTLMDAVTESVLLPGEIEIVSAENAVQLLDSLRHYSKLPQENEEGEEVERNGEKVARRIQVRKSF